MEIKRTEASNFATGGDLKGMDNARDALEHYLDGSGEPMEVDADDLREDVPEFDVLTGNDSTAFAGRRTAAPVSRPSRPGSGRHREPRQLDGEGRVVMSLSQYDNERLRAIEDRTRSEDPVFAARFDQGCARLDDPRSEWVLPLIAAVVFATFGVAILLFSLVLATNDTRVPGGAGTPTAPVQDDVRVDAP